MKDSVFYSQVELMLTILPDVMSEDCFALKGGTALNLFVRDMPRLSVDIDLTYLPHEDRAASLKGISTALDKIAIRIVKRHAGVTVHKTISSRTRIPAVRKEWPAHVAAERQDDDSTSTRDQLESRQY